MSRVTPLGCSTKGWMSTLDTAPSVLRALETDPSLELLIFRALHRHTSRLPKMMRRGQMITTRAVRPLRRRDPEIVLTTHCSGQAYLQSMLRHRYRSSR